MMAAMSARLSPWLPSALPSDVRTVYQSVVAARSQLAEVGAVVGRSGELLGPFDALLRSPKIGDAVQRVGTALRRDSTLPRDVTETAILTVAAHWRASYEWYAHAAIAASSGLLPDDDLQRLRTGHPPQGSDTARTIWSFVSQLLTDGGVDDEVYARASAMLGERGTVELVLLVGYYALLAAVLNTFRIGTPEGVDDPFGGR
jgi:4-carboxymuconolactone decarboxylase